MILKIIYRKPILRLFFLCMAVIITGTAFSELFPRRAPTRTCGIPKNYDYETRQMSARSIVELTEQDVTEVAELDDQKKIVTKVKTRYFHRSNQLPLVVPAVLTESDFRFQSNGNWDLAVNAHFNPQRGNALIAIQQALDNQPNYLHYLNGSRFHIAIRCYVRDKINNNRKALLAAQTLPVFWVKSGEPCDRQFASHSCQSTRFQNNLSEFYDQIDFVEIELYYEK